MIRLFLLLFFALAPFGPAWAQRSDECLRPPTQDLADYKEAYVPQEFHWESFNWEIADLLVLAALLAIASLLSLRHFQRRWFTALISIALLYFGILRGGC
ncbi:hypothetical protein, partial [Pontiella sp.]